MISDNETLDLMTSDNKTNLALMIGDNKTSFDLMISDNKTLELIISGG